LIKFDVGPDSGKTTDAGSEEGAVALSFSHLPKNMNQKFRVTGVIKIKNMNPKSPLSLSSGACLAVTKYVCMFVFFLLLESCASFVIPGTGNILSGRRQARICLGLGKLNTKVPTGHRLAMILSPPRQIQSDRAEIELVRPSDLNLIRK
jgi:hypothetical protein